MNKPRINPARVGIVALMAGCVTVCVLTMAIPHPDLKAEAAVQDGLQAYGNGYFQLAEGICDRALADHPKAPRVRLLAGLLYEQRGDWNGAERVYRESLDLFDRDDPARDDVEVSLCDLCRRRGDAQAALTALSKVAARRGESPRLRQARILALVDMKRFDEALSETRKLADESHGNGVASQLEKRIRRELDAVDSGG